MSRQTRYRGGQPIYPRGATEIVVACVICGTLMPMTVDVSDDGNHYDVPTACTHHEEVTDAEPFDADEVKAMRDAIEAAIAEKFAAEERDYNDHGGSPS